MTRTEQISNFRDQGYEIVEITVSKGQFKDDNGRKIPHSNRPGAFMLNPKTNGGVLVSHIGEVISVTLTNREIT